MNISYRDGLFSHTALKIGAVSLLLLAGCEGGGVDLGGLGSGGFNLRDASTQMAPRPVADQRGLITYPTYQVVEARQGDTVSDVAGRLGLSAAALAAHNGLKTDSRLRRGELLALPTKVGSGGGTDIASIASSAIDAADKTKQPAAQPARLPIARVAKPQAVIEPIRHQVERGETAYSIARLYDVSVTALAKWNRLGTDLAVREGQQLLIPVVDTPPPANTDTAKPGAGSPTPVPPSASKPLPRIAKPAPIPPSPDLEKFKTDASPQKFLMPVQGKILSPYSGKKGGNEGIDIASTPGTAVKAAADGEVALVSKSVGANTIVLLRHADNIYTVYSNVTDVRVQKGQKVQRGQRVGVVSGEDPAFLHFEVRRGTESVDPAPFL